VTYSILYGIMLNACFELNPFPYGQLFKNPKAKWRVLCSLIVINVLPFIIFASMFTTLESIRKPPNIPNIIGVFLFSMIVFAFHRGFQAFIVSKPTRLYLETEICRIFDYPPLCCQNWQGHAIGASVYVLLALLGILLVLFPL